MGGEGAFIYLVDTTQETKPDRSLEVYPAKLDSGGVPSLRFVVDVILVNSDFTERTQKLHT